MSTEQAKTNTAVAQSKPKEIVAEASSPEPIIVDLGKKNRKQVRKLRKGKPGRLMDRVEDTIEHLRENGALAAGVQPIVVVVKQKTRRRGKRWTKAWGLG
jgi:hypothetical protein